MPTTAAPEMVTLRAGFIVSVEALRFAWDLEARGFHVRLAVETLQ